MVPELCLRRLTLVPEKTSDGAQAGPFSAMVQIDPAMESTVILLSYDETEHPDRSVTVGIAPELGSNTYRSHELDGSLRIGRDAVESRHERDTGQHDRTNQ